MAATDPRSRRETLADVQVRATPVDRRDTVAAERNPERRLNGVRADSIDGQKRANDHPIATEGYDAVAGRSRNSGERARNRMQEAYRAPEFERFTGGASGSDTTVTVPDCSGVSGLDR